MFIQQINPLTGQAEWTQVQPQDAGVDGADATSRLLASSSYLDMVNDSRRNQAYRLALQRCLQPQHTVLDIGTGTGLLAMMAARSLAGPGMEQEESQAPAAAEAAAPPPTSLPPLPQQQQGQAKEGVAAGEHSVAAAAAHLVPPVHPVLACELFPPMAHLARSIIKDNGLDQLVNVVLKRSDELAVGQGAGAAAGAAGAGAAGADGVPGSLAGGPTGAAQGATGGGTAADKRRAMMARVTPPVHWDLAEKVDIIVTEIFDSQLLGEGLLPTLRHAVPHLLKPGGRVIPALARVYAQLVESPVLRSMSRLVPPAPQQYTSTSSSTGAGAGPGTEALAALVTMESTLHLEAAAAATAAAGSQDGGPMRRPPRPVHELHLDVLHGHGLIRPLGPPQLVLEIDLAAPPPLPAGEGGTGQEERLSSEVKMLLASSPGTAHGAVLWWQLAMDPAGELLLSTAPSWVGPDPVLGGDGGVAPSALQLPQQWRDHWKQCWCPLLPETSLQVQPGDVVAVSVSHDSINLYVDLVQQPAAAQAKAQAQGQSQGQGPVPEGAFDTGSPAGGASPLPPLGSWTSPMRLWQLQELEGRWGPLAAAVAQAAAQLLQGQGQGSAAASCQLPGSSPAALPGGPAGLEVVVLGDGPMLPLVAMTACRQAAAAAAAAGAGTGSGAGVSWSITAVQDLEVSRRWVRAAAALLGPSSSSGSSSPGVTCVSSKAFWEKLRRSCEEAGGTGAAAGAAADQPGSTQLPPLLLVAEPYYQELEGQLPWYNLRFWNQLQRVRTCSPGRRVLSLPGGAALRAVAVSLPDLYRSRTRLGLVEGLDLTRANGVLGVVGAGAQHRGDAGSGDMELHGEEEEEQVLLAVPSWQCGAGYRELSQRVTLLELDFAQELQDRQGHVVLPLYCPAAAAAVQGAQGPACHALVLWMDYSLPAGGAGCGEDSGAAGPVLSEGPDPGGRPLPRHQGVLLLQEPVALQPGAGAGEGGCQLRVRVSFRHEDGDMEFCVKRL